MGFLPGEKARKPAGFWAAKPVLREQIIQGITRKEETGPTDDPDGDIIYLLLSVLS